MKYLPGLSPIPEESRLSFSSTDSSTSSVASNNRVSQAAQSIHSKTREPSHLSSKDVTPVEKPTHWKRNAKIAALLLGLTLVALILVAALAFPPGGVPLALLLVGILVGIAFISSALIAKLAAPDEPSVEEP